MDKLDRKIGLALPFVADVFIDVTANRTEEHRPLTQGTLLSVLHSELARLQEMGGPGDTEAKSIFRTIDAGPISGIWSDC